MVAAAGNGDLTSLRGKVVLVTGANGYVGRELTAALVAAGVAEVRARDVVVSAVSTSGIVNAEEFDLAGDADAVARAVVGVDIVLHVASYGMSGPAMLDKRRIHAVNVLGTNALLDACVKEGVTAFVYTSTYNVVFGGQEILNGDEASTPYFPLDKQVDEYSRTKTMAEQLVLSYDGRGRKPLRCCAIRPNAIYGEGEERHFARIVDLALRGMTRFTIGPKDAKLDWVHVTNLVSGHLLAAANLVGPNASAAGEAFFISDGHPVNNFEFVQPLLDAVGSKPPIMRFPTWLMLKVAFVFEILYSCSFTRPMFNYVPLLTRAEINKCSVAHYCSTAKAARLLGYKPLVQHPAGMLAVAAHWKRKMAATK